MREARAAAALDDPFICKVYEAGGADDGDYIAMELVDGRTLKSPIAAGPVPPDELLPTASEVAEALKVVHDYGIVHRDLKPANIMLGPTGHAKANSGNGPDVTMHGGRPSMQKITPFLWFDGRAEEAAGFYASIFPNSRIGSVRRHGDAGPGPKGSVMSVTFQLDGQEFIALNGGPQFTFSPAISFFVNCQSQDEVDDLWERLSEGGQKNRCGWLQDKFGVTWQVVPTVLGQMLQDKDAERSRRVMKAMLGMEKLDIAALRQAFESAPTPQ